MQRFRVDLKTFLGLAMPNQCRHTITKLILGWFVGGLFGQKNPNLDDSHMKISNMMHQKRLLQRELAPY